MTRLVEGEGEAAEARRHPAQRVVGRTRRSGRCRRRDQGRSGSRTPGGPSARSSSWAPRAWGGPSWRRPWRALFDSRNMVRIDMSEYMEKHTVSRLIGSPRATWGMRRGPAHRSGQAQALLGGALRRDRRPTTCSMCSSDPRRREGHGCPRQDRELQEHRDHHDLEHPVPGPHRGISDTGEISERAKVGHEELGRHFRPEF